MGTSKPSHSILHVDATREVLRPDIRRIGLAGNILQHEQLPPDDVVDPQALRLDVANLAGASARRHPHGCWTVRLRLHAAGHYYKYHDYCSYHCDLYNYKNILTLVRMIRRPTGIVK